MVLRFQSHASNKIIFEDHARRLVSSFGGLQDSLVDMYQYYFTSQTGYQVSTEDDQPLIDPATQHLTKSPKLQS